MNRLLVAVLAAIDAVIAAAVGVAAALAPLTLFWVLGLGGTADWGALWPAAVRVWQLGHLVPLHITLGDDYLIATGIPVDGARFVVSLAPLAFAVFTAVFAARSGARAARAGAWLVGVAAGTVTFAALAAGMWATAGNPVAAVYGWQSLLLPTLVFALPALSGALVGACATVTTASSTFCATGWTRTRGGRRCPRHPPARSASPSPGSSAWARSWSPSRRSPAGARWWPSSKPRTSMRPAPRSSRSDSSPTCRRSSCGERRSPQGRASRSAPARRWRRRERASAWSPAFPRWASSRNRPRRGCCCSRWRSSRSGSSRARSRERAWPPSRGRVPPRG